MEIESIVWTMYGIVFIILVIFLAIYIINTPKEIEWRSKIMKDLCNQNNLTFNQGNPMWLEQQTCYKQEGIIRRIYYAPEWWGDFNKAENQYLEETKT